MPDGVFSNTRENIFQVRVRNAMPKAEIYFRDIVGTRHVAFHAAGLLVCRHLRYFGPISNLLR